MKSWIFNAFQARLLALFIIASFVTSQVKGSFPSEIAFDGKTVDLYYNGGCTFKNASNHPSVKVLAEYKDATHQSAMIHCKVGKGNVILSGVHFEVCPKSLKQEGGNPMIARKLETSERDRKALITTLLS